jgi:hypothetical protein
MMDFIASIPSELTGPLRRTGITVGSTAASFRGRFGSFFHDKKALSYDGDYGRHTQG